MEKSGYADLVMTSQSTITISRKPQIKKAPNDIKVFSDFNS